VERSEIPAPVGVERVADDRRSLDRLHRREREDTSEPLMLQAAKRLAQEPHLMAHDLSAKLAVGAAPVALDANLLGQVERNSYRQGMMPAGELDQRRAVLGLHARRVHDGEPSPGKTLT